jgi:hypothetical protein
MSEEVKVFKLITGEEMIARVTDETVTSITVDRPRVVAIMPNPNGQMGVTLIPLFASNQEGKAILERSAIAATSCEVNSELEKSYISQTTGIALA